MSKKFTHIRVNTPTGQVDVPARPVAEQRADYYAIEVDGHEKDSDDYEAEVFHGLTGDYDLIDWMLNNSNWEDWSGIAEKVNSKVLVTDEDFFTSSDDLELITK